MNRIPEKSPFKSPRIYDCLRLLALEAILGEKAVTELTVYSADADLLEAVNMLCEGLGIECLTKRQPSEKKSWSIRRAYDALPHSLQGLLSFRHLALRWKLRRLRPLRWFPGERGIFICSYFFNLDESAAARGHFHSRQWGRLPEWLADQGWSVNWIHHFLADRGQPGVSTALSWAESFNRGENRQGRHAFLESYLSMRVVLTVVRRWVWLHRLSWRLRGATAAFRPIESAASFWPLLRDDWRNSLQGTAAMTSCLCYELFEAALSDVPEQTRGLYLYEGQGWESAFIHAWRRNGHGRLLGVPHSSMPFWYLNIFDDRRCVAGVQTCGKPQPDGLAINGQMARRALLSAGFPAERLVSVEALRFEHLAESVEAEHLQSLLARDRSAVRRILVLGDFTRRQTLKMLRCVEDATRSMSNLRITIKLHPACAIDEADVGSISCEFTTLQLADLVGKFDFAFSSNSTSAALDALLAGLPVAVFLDDDDLNQSPLRGEPGIRFVSTGQELAGAILAEDTAQSRRRVDDFFWLDRQLPRWRHALSLAEDADAG